MWKSPHGLPQLSDGQILVPRKEWSQKRNSSGVHNGWDSRFEGRASGGSDRLRWFCDFQRGHRVLSEDAVWKLAQWGKERAVRIRIWLEDEAEPADLISAFKGGLDSCVLDLSTLGEVAMGWKAHIPGRFERPTGLVRLGGRWWLLTEYNWQYG